MIGFSSVRSVPCPKTHLNVAWFFSPKYQSGQGCHSLFAIFSNSVCILKAVSSTFSQRKKLFGWDRTPTCCESPQILLSNRAFFLSNELRTPSDRTILVLYSYAALLTHWRHIWYHGPRRKALNVLCRLFSREFCLVLHPSILTFHVVCPYYRIWWRFVHRWTYSKIAESLVKRRHPVVYRSFRLWVCQSWFPLCRFYRRFFRALPQEIPYTPTQPNTI